MPTYRIGAVSAEGTRKGKKIRIILFSEAENGKTDEKTCFANLYSVISPMTSPILSLGQMIVPFTMGS